MTPVITDVKQRIMMVFLRLMHTSPFKVRFLECFDKHNVVFSVLFNIRTTFYIVVGSSISKLFSSKQPAKGQFTWSKTTLAKNTKTTPVSEVSTSVKSFETKKEISIKHADAKKYVHSKIIGYCY